MFFASLFLLDQLDPLETDGLGGVAGDLQDIFGLIPYQLGTKQSGGKRMTAKAERVTQPRLFDATLRLLRLLAIVTSADTAVIAFVLDFSDAYWQI